MGGTSKSESTPLPRVESSSGIYSLGGSGQTLATTKSPEQVRHSDTETSVFRSLEGISPSKQSFSRPLATAELKQTSDTRNDSSEDLSEDNLEDLSDYDKLQRIPLPINDYNYEFVTSWHTVVLPSLGKIIPNSDSGTQACHLVGKRIKLNEIGPVVQVVSKTLPDLEQQTILRKEILALFPNHLSKDVEVEFKKGALKRTVDHKNTHWAENVLFQEKPDPGCSIGVHGYHDSTATLGGYITIDDIDYILTVHHILPDDYDPETRLLRGQVPSLDQASPQECIEGNFEQKLERLIQKLGICCEDCRRLRSCLSSPPFTEVDLPVERHFEVVSALEGEKNTRCCLTAKKAIQLKDSEQRCKAYSFASMVLTSGLCSRKTTSYGKLHSMEMDWGVYKPLPDRIGRNLRCLQNCIPREHFGKFSEQYVSAWGRSSGHQRGILNTTMSYIDHGDHQTWEWTVLKPEGMSNFEWNCGMGIAGESGSWVCDSESVWGMIWARGEEDADAKVYFTPMYEILADIKEKGRNLGWEIADIKITR